VQAVVSAEWFRVVRNRTRDVSPPRRNAEAAGVQDVGYFGAGVNVMKPMMQTVILRRFHSTEHRG